jgi:hypothetical protein
MPRVSQFVPLELDPSSTQELVVITANLLLHQQITALEQIWTLVSGE